MTKSKYISIKQYLAKRGILPVKERNYYGMYLSPLREERTPSFKVDYTKNLWYDFGTNEGGSIVDLVMKLESCSLAKAFVKLDSFSFHRNCFVTPKPYSKSTIEICDIKLLTHPALLEYLTFRSIDTEIAKHYCREIHYSIREKNYFAIGFENDSGGWELRNRAFKG